MFANHALAVRRYDVPGPVTGYHLDPAQGFFSAILPLGVDKTNLVTNPSVEVDTTGWTAAGASAVTRDATQQKFGAYSLKVVTTTSTSGGVYFGTVSLTAGTQYWASVWFKGVANRTYAIGFFTTGAVAVQEGFFLATGFWQRLSVAYLETATTTRRIYIRKTNDTTTSTFYADGLQVEASQLTTYLDGDMKGFVRGRQDFYWTGTPHASTSVRIGQSRSGGKVVPLDQLGFRLLSIIGLGLGGIVNQVTPLAKGGAYYGGTVIADRQFTLVGQVDGGGLIPLSQKRQGLIDLFKPDVVSPAQPLVLRYQPTDDCGNQAGNEQEIVCVYEGDLSGRTDNLNSERLGLAFRLFYPFVSRDVGEAGAALGYQGSVANANFALYRTPAGQWTAFAGGAFNDDVNAIAFDRQHGRIYFGGQFTTAGGVACNRVCYYDIAAGTFNAMSTGLNSDVNTNGIVIAANGDVWVAGLFTTVGGAATKGLARWNYAAGTWTAFNVATATFTAVNGVAINNAGIVYIGGQFTDWDGIAAADHGAKYDGATWTAFGTGFSNSVTAVGLDGRNRPWFGGNFATANGVTVNQITYWTGTTFVNVGGLSVGHVVYDFLLSIDGKLYLTGDFNTVGGVTASRIAYWNGTAFFPMGSGFDGTGTGWDMAQDPSGLLYVGGTMTSAGGLLSPDSIVAWNGSSWVYVAADLPSTSKVGAVTINNGGLYLGYAVSGTATTAALTTITNNGSSQSGPRIVFTGPGTVYQLVNLTTGKSIYLNLILQASEQATLDLSDPSNITFVSTFRGNILNTILPGSQLSDFVLLPGANSISLFIAGTTTAATAAVLTWRNTCHSLDAAIPGRLLP